MLIDWFTVGAQALNFIILVWLLKRLLYKPILDAINAREQRIARELADADAKKAEARKERDDFQRKNEEFDAQRAALFKKATEKAEIERQRLLGEARQVAGALREKQAAALRTDASHLNDAIRIRTQEEVFAIAKRVLADLCTASVQERVVEVFSQRLRDLDDSMKHALAEALKSGTEPALIRSGLELSTGEQDAMRRLFKEVFSVDISLRFETSPELICGIELTTRGHKLAWSVADYLGSLEKAISELVRTQADTGAKAPPSSAERRAQPPESVQA